MRCGYCKQEGVNLEHVKAHASTGGGVATAVQVQPPQDAAQAPTLFTDKPGYVTTKQLGFIGRLLAERDVPQALRDQIHRYEETGMSRRDASDFINHLQTLPIVKHTVQVEEDVVITSTVPNGTYTVVFDNDRRTLRLRSADWAGDLPAGSQVAEFLSGPENETDFTGFAFIVKGKPRVWKRFRSNGDSAITKALDVLLNGGLEKAKEAGEAYALESSRCWRCNHTLTVPVSIHRGLGPVCAGKLDIGDFSEGGDEA